MRREAPSTDEATLACLLGRGNALPALWEDTGALPQRQVYCPGPGLPVPDGNGAAPSPEGLASEGPTRVGEIGEGTPLAGTGDMGGEGTVI